LGPIVRAPSADDASRAAEAILRADIGIAEVTMTVPNAICVMESVIARFLRGLTGLRH
jgi:2-keto-3-deoxy-6-phosphogluconate aldolase